MMNILGKLISALVLLALSVTMTANDTTAVSEPKKPKGFDAGQYVGAGRHRNPSKMQFVSEKFTENFYVGLLGDTRVPFSEDYGFAYSAGASAMKWFKPFLGVRMDAMVGYANNNLTAERVPQFSLGTSVLFNVTSYMAGFDKRRFCEISTVMGVGYSCWWDLMTAHYFTGNVGANVNLRLSERMSLYVEPYLPFYLSQGGLKYGFATKIGAYYDFSAKTYEPKAAGKYFVHFSAGVQVQNSELVKTAGKKGYNTSGMTYTLGAGRRFDDYFALRLSAVYSRHFWTVYYGGQKMPANYFAFRAEGVLDVLQLVMNKLGNNDFPLGCGVVMGPEAGCMLKKDLDENLSKHYVGFTGAFYVDIRFAKRFYVFMEPRLNILPYSAPHDVSTANNINRNYYDGLFNFNIGMAVDL